MIDKRKIALVAVLVVALSMTSCGSTAHILVFGTEPQSRGSSFGISNNPTGILTTPCVIVGDIFIIPKFYPKLRWPLLIADSFLLNILNNRER